MADFERIVLAQLKALREEVHEMRALMADEGEPEPTCPYCGHTELEDTSTPDVPRTTCVGDGCGRSFNPEVSVDG